MNTLLSRLLKQNLFTSLFLLTIFQLIIFSAQSQSNEEFELFEAHLLENKLLDPTVKSNFKQRHNATDEELRSIECEFRTIAHETVLAHQGRFVIPSIYIRLKDSLITIFDEKFVHFKETGEIIHHHDDDEKLPIDYYREREETLDGEYDDVVFGNRTTCFNADLENSNTDGWSASSGSVATGFDLNLNAGWDMGPMNSETGNHAIMGPGAGDDGPSGNAFPRVFPEGGQYSIRVGNVATGSGAARIRYSFPVTTDTELFLYHFAAVLEDNGHPADEQPFLSINLIVDGQEIECGEYFQVAEQGAEGYLDGPGDVRYRPWTTISIALSDYIGQNATVEFTTADCSQGGHFGYAYIDAECTPMPTLETTPLNCENPTIDLSAPPGADGYEWTGPGIVGASNTETITVNAPGNYSVTVIPVQGPSCSYVLSTEVVAEASDVDVQFDIDPPQFCLGESVQFTDQTTVLTGEAITDYNWDFGDGNTSTDENPEHTYASSGVFDVTLTVTTEANCDATLTQQVEVFPEIENIDIDVVDIVCGANEGSITINNVNGGTAPFDYDLVGSSTNTDGVFNDVDPGTYTVIITDDNNCSYTQENIDLLGTPAIDSIYYTAMDEGCDQANGSISVDEVFGGEAPFTYDLVTVSQNTLGVFNNLTEGSYTLTITDQNNCEYTENIDLSNSPDITSAEAITTSEYCDQQNGTITIVNIVGGTPDYTYEINTGENNMTGEFTNLSSGSYTIDIVDQLGCDYTLDNVVIDFVEGINNATYTSAPTLCAENNGQINITAVEGGTPDYTYSINNGTPNSTGDFSSLAPGSYTIQIVDDAGCTYETEEIIIDPSETIETVELSIEPAKCLQANGSFTFNAINGGTPPYDISADGISGSEGVYDGLLHGVYTYTITDAEGCIYEGLAEIPLDMQADNVRIPNVITVNSDGLNDIWYVSADCVEEFECVIINRWGNKIYEYFDIDGHWDGKTLSGTEVTEGVYFYLLKIVFADETEAEFHGNITVSK